jgi:hypothetical protein
MEIAAISVMLHVAMSSTRNRHINSKSEKKKVLCKTYHKMPVRESSGYSSRIPLCHHLTFSSYRVSRKALKTAHQLNLSGFAGSVTDGVVHLALGRVTGGQPERLPQHQPWWHRGIHMPRCQGG